MSQVLLAFALDFESESDMSLGVYTEGGVSPKGIGARDAYHRWAGTIEDRWAERFSAQPVRELRNSAERLGGRRDALGDRPGQPPGQ
jgi:hypothetical protein